MTLRYDSFPTWCDGRKMNGIWSLMERSVREELQMDNHFSRQGARGPRNATRTSQPPSITRVIKSSYPAA